MNGLNTDWLPVQTEAHQSWQPKTETDKLIKRERQRKKYIVIHTIVVERYKEKLDTRITSPHIRPHRGSEIQSYRHVFGQASS